MDTDSPYFLRSPRLGFRWWTADDLPLATLLWGDPAVTQFLGGPYDAAKIAERLERHLRFAREGGVQYWPLFLLGARVIRPASSNSDGDEEGSGSADPRSSFVGCCGLRPPEDGVYEGGLHLRPQFWRGGWGVEASLAVFAHAFGTLGARAITAEVHPGHGASQRLLEKLGFVPHGTKMHTASGIGHMVFMLDREAYGETARRLGETEQEPLSS